jgi:hypothetical protein
VRRTSVLLPWLLLWTSEAPAEVADKVPTAASSLVWLVSIGIVAWLLGRVWSWLPLVLVPFGAFVALATIVELNDPHVGPAILLELGTGYVVLQYLFAIAYFVAPVAAWWIGRRGRA